MALANCGVPNFSTTLFNSTIGTTNSFSVLDNSENDQPESPGPPISTSSPIKNQMSPRNPSEPIKIIVMNFQSIKNKHEEILNIIDTANPSIIIGNETWLSPSIYSTEIFPPEYEVIRKDRNDGYGGVLIAIKRELTTEALAVETSSTTIQTVVATGSTNIFPYMLDNRQLLNFSKQ